MDEADRAEMLTPLDQQLDKLEDLTASERCVCFMDVFLLTL